MSGAKIFAYAGDDTIITGRQYNTLDGGNGNDTIQGYLSSSTIKIDSGTIQNHSFSGQDVILSFGTDSLTLRGVKGNNLNFVDANGNAFSTVFGSTDTLINGTAGADDLVNNTGNAQINLLGGNDIIEGLDESSTLQIMAGELKSPILIKDGNFILTVGEGKITLTDVYSEA